MTDRPKYYDTFTFFNELDILELRLEELYDYVDYFVLVESDHTFTNIPKPYYFEENKQRYSKYLDKIRHIKIKSMKDSNPWENEFHQRNCLVQGCSDAASDDIISISDVDEIPRPSVIETIRCSNNDIDVLHIPFFFFKFNFVSLHEDCYIPVIFTVKRSILSDYSVQQVRGMRSEFERGSYYCGDYTCGVHHHAGWHFSYLGDDEFVRQKFVSFSHASDHTKDQVDAFTIENELDEGGVRERYYVKVDEYFPKTVRENLDKYQRYIKHDTTNSMADYFSNIG